MDLTAVEGLGDLLAAETRAQKQQALDQMAGGLARLYAGWADRLTGALAHMEAAIDFVEEEDVPVDLLGPVRVTLEAVLYDLRGHLAGAACGERLREGLRVAVLGPPNAGKSTLVNALAGRDVAIVTAEAGTTRDVIEVRLDLQGWPVLVADTAGPTLPICGWFCSMPQIRNRIRRVWR
jgi:tRNA modification GTPase